MRVFPDSDSIEDVAAPQGAYTIELQSTTGRSPQGVPEDTHDKKNAPLRTKNSQY